MHVVAYTDGSCNAKSKLGGAGSIVRIYDGEDEIHRHEISDAYSSDIDPYVPVREYKGFRMRRDSPYSI